MSNNLSASKVWGTLSKINVNDKAEKKGQFTYLSWSWAWEVFASKYPLSTYRILDDVVFNDGTVEVRVEVTCGCEPALTHTMWLPVMNYQNKAMANPSATDINKTRMRCLVKCLAMFGLGHYIYAGEDLPEAPEPKKPSADDGAAKITELCAVGNMDAAAKAWKYAVDTGISADVYKKLHQATRAKIDALGA